MSANLKLYRGYLALDQATKRLQALGVEPSRFALPGPGEEHGEQFWRRYLDSDLEAGKVPDLYQYGAVQVYIPDFLDYSLPTEERDKKAQERREKLIRDFVAAYPNVIVARYGNGQTYLWTENEYDGFGVTINVGQALCERVLVGEDVTEVRDPELAQQALEEVPMVKKVTPRYEWRCNDAELIGAGA